MSKKMLKEDFISSFIGGFLRDINDGQVRAAIKSAKKNKLPSTILDQMSKIDKDLEDLEDFLKTV